MSNNVLRPALIAAFGVMLSLPMFASAAVVNSTTTATADFTVPQAFASNTTTGTSSATANTTSKSTSTNIAKFDASTGVLTGVKVNVASQYKQSTTLAAPGVAGNSGKKDAAGTGTGSLQISLPGASAPATWTTTAQPLTCDGKRDVGCSASTAPGKTTVDGTLTAGALDQYVGAGTSFAVNTQATVAARTTNNTFASATTTSTLDWTGTLSATYEYLLHAAQSFEDGSSALTLNLDFGSVYLGDSAADQLFSIFNGKGARVGLQLTNVSETGSGNGMFSTNLDTYNNIAAGGSQGFKASFLASQLGSFSTTYQLTLADLAPSTYAANTLYSGYGLTLNLAGNVIARPVQNDVPEPATLMLLGLGAAAFGVSRKRKA
ncbi:PEP-CTERM sorting domain-containing protein [Massilia suwonensis]|uniref:PEP-CTERM sorting domain-containing protein n=1 Tax=Massilia suwonensis TaxID=648895 RepID=A0ABW0MLH4_9BURK